ncbi:hypothetical protein U9Z10_23495 [Escherichia coli]
MDLQTVELALNFLGRAQLVGNEVPAFCQVHNALMAMRAQMMNASLASSELGDSPQTSPAPGD